MCANTGLALYLCLLLPPAATVPVFPAPEFDHHHAAELNETAMNRLLAGNAGTARLLLERATVLDPSDPVLAENLAALRAYEPGTGAIEQRPLPVAPSMPQPVPTRPGMNASIDATVTLPPLPPPWPPK